MALFSMFKKYYKFKDDIIKDSIAGNLCRCTGYQPIIKAANSLNKNDLKNMGQLGRTYIKDYFSWDVLGKDYLAFYDWVRNGGSTPSFMDIF